MIKNRRGLKQKGSRLERKFAALIRHFGLDDNAKRMVLSGSDWAFKGDILTKLPYHFEVKNQEKVKIWEWWEQAQSQAGMKTPVVVFSSNFRPIMVCLKAEDFLSILKAQLTK